MANSLDEADDYVPQRATSRPFSALPRPRRREPREAPDAAARERTDWLSWIAERIVADTLAAGLPEDDHWKDTRWDNPPPEWSFENWKAARRRAHTDA